MPPMSSSATEVLAGQSGAIPGQASRQGFPRAARVRAKADFDRIFQHGKRNASPVLAVHWLIDAQAPRLGLAVSRRVDPHAVGRNRIKRVLRDHFRKLRPGLCNGAYVVVARSAAAQASGSTLRTALDRGLHKLGALPAPAALGTMPPAAAVTPASPAPQRTSS